MNSVMEPFQTTVSLPDHLRSGLLPLPEILPNDLRTQLSPYLAEHVSEIPHLVLLNIAKWARTDSARAQLCARNLEPGQYTIISLLAGTTTSPSSKFPPHVARDSTADAAKRAIQDRRALAAMLNALLSIGGAGYAAWWASIRTGWRDEWRVLFALLVALTLAVSESVLYWIWQSRKETSRRRHAHRLVQETRKEDDGSEVDLKSDEMGVDVSGSLRKRKTRITEE